LLGSFIDIYNQDQTGFTLFIYDAFSKIGYSDILSTMIRSLVFGFTIGVIGCYKGITTGNGTEGVGRAANSSVVIVMLLIFLEEMAMVKIFNSFQQ
jgi:phospholipid/cholesterol/gamma-HCH transport system permease protein